MSRRVRSASALITALAALIALAGCSVPIDPPSPPRPTTASPSPTARALGCADLASGADLARALGGPAMPADPVAVALAAASDVAYATAVTAAGGLQCAWRGPAQDGFTPVLTVQLLPDPRSQWTAMLFGDGPATETETFGSHTVTATSGDPGYGATARVGGTWAFIVRTYPPTGTIPADTVTTLTPAFTSILDAAAARGSRLSSSASTPTASTCAQVLSVDRLSTALGGAATYQPTAIEPAYQGIADVARSRVGDVGCVGSGATHGLEFAVARGGAGLVAKLRLGFASADLGPYAPIDLAGQASGDWAIGRACGQRPGLCSVIFTHRGDAYQVSDAPDPKAVAEAIIAQNP